VFVRGVFAARLSASPSFGVFVAARLSAFSSFRIYIAMRLSPTSPLLAMWAPPRRIALRVGGHLSRGMYEVEMRREECGVANVVNRHDIYMNII
jgi:hypothetical protein